MKPRAIDNALLMSLLALFMSMMAAFAFYVRNIQQADVERLETIEPRFARLAGLELDKSELISAVNATKNALARHIYSANRDISQAGNDAQQRARDVFSKAGLEVLSSQVLPAKVSKELDRIPITVRVEGEYLALQTALASLPSLSPTLFVEGFNAQNVNGNNPNIPVRLVVQFELFVLRARS